jgi:hypothetical protein
VIVSCPVAAPAEVGKNCIWSVAVWEGFNISGKLPPTMVKAAPVIEAELTVTAEVPVEVNVTDCVVGEFTVTLPKLKLAELIVSCGLAATPVPLRATTAVLPAVELLVMVICPVAAPATVGRN